MSSLTIGNSTQVNYAIEIKNKKFNQIAHLMRLLSSGHLVTSISRSNRIMKTDFSIKQVEERLGYLIYLLETEVRASFWINNSNTSVTNLLKNQLPLLNSKGGIEQVIERLMIDTFVMFWNELK